MIQGDSSESQNFVILIDLMTSRKLLVILNWNESMSIWGMEKIFSVLINMNDSSFSLEMYGFFETVLFPHFKKLLLPNESYSKLIRNLWNGNIFFSKVNEKI